MPNNFYTIIAHPTEEKLLLAPAGDAWTLPLYNPVSSWTPQIEALVTGMQEQIGLRLFVRYCAYIHVERKGETRNADAVYVTDNLSPDQKPPAGYRWVSEAELGDISLATEWVRPYIAAWFAEEKSGIVPPLRPPWGCKGWYEEMQEWVQAELAALQIELLAPPHQVKHWDISSVLKAPTDSGTVYIKAIPAWFATEPRITSGLHRLFPAVVPSPLATWEAPNEGRLILRDFGGKLLWSKDIPPEAMVEALRLFAGMQIECIGKDEELFATGCRDRRLEGMPGLIGDLLADPAALRGLTDDEQARLHAIMPRIESVSAQLASGHVPQTLMHGDFHGGNVALTDTGYVIFDWTDACISHPFFDLLTVTDNGPIDSAYRGQLIDAYLSVWAAQGLGSPEELRATCDLALKLGPLYHAISYWQIAKICEESTADEMESALPFFLKLGLERLEAKE